MAPPGARLAAISPHARPPRRDRAARPSPCPRSRWLPELRARGLSRLEWRLLLDGVLWRLVGLCGAAYCFGERLLGALVVALLRKRFGWRVSLGGGSGLPVIALRGSRRTPSRSWSSRTSRMGPGARRAARAVLAARGRATEQLAARLLEALAHVREHGASAAGDRPVAHACDRIRTAWHTRACRHRFSTRARPRALAAREIGVGTARRSRRPRGARQVRRRRAGRRRRRPRARWARSTPRPATAPPRRLLGEEPPRGRRARRRRRRDGGGSGGSGSAARPRPAPPPPPPRAAHAVDARARARARRARLARRTGAAARSRTACSPSSAHAGAPVPGGDARPPPPAARARARWSSTVEHATLRDAVAPDRRVFASAPRSRALGRARASRGCASSSVWSAGRGAGAPPGRDVLLGRGARSSRELPCAVGVADARDGARAARRARRRRLASAAAAAAAAAGGGGAGVNRRARALVARARRDRAAERGARASPRARALSLSLSASLAAARALRRRRRAERVARAREGRSRAAAAAKARADGEPLEEALGRAAAVRRAGVRLRDVHAFAQALPSLGLEPPKDRRRRDGDARVCARVSDVGSLCGTFPSAPDPRRVGGAARRAARAVAARRARPHLGRAS